MREYLFDLKQGCVLFAINKKKYVIINLPSKFSANESNILMIKVYDKYDV